MNTSKGFSMFQIGILVVCGLGIIFGMLIFSGKIPVGDSGTDETLRGSLVVWGTLPGDAMRATLELLKQAYNEVNITYSEKSPASFQSELVNALASGVGPDMVYITPADVVQNRDRLFEIPYASFPQGSFQSTFVDQGNLFLTNTGVLAFPFVLDPMVTYYNRDMLAGSFSVNPPKTWDEVVALNKKITIKDDAGKLTTQTVALGTFDNISHAKEIVSAMIFQTGNKIVTWDPVNKKYISTFGQGVDGASGVANALGFYTAFANPGDADRYSWNGSLPLDVNQFIAGKLAVYFGYASELAGIRAKNPNLNFDVSVFPQRTQGTIKSTFGKMHGLAIIKVSKNTTLALAMAQQLASKQTVQNYLSFQPTAIPARRDMVTIIDTDAHQTLFYKSAIIAQGLLDPDQAQTTALFKRFIDQINAGAARPEAIISPGDSLLSGILQKAQRQETEVESI